VTKVFLLGSINAHKSHVARAGPEAFHDLWRRWIFDRQTFDPETRCKCASDL
jgi:hypothetical protein